ncbi:M20/M25/M40 family metallo-hydrolase [Romboutsia sp.]|uniref:M20/M25/M40 family metallo-hydrolase n=1 Tax=Romboutsia sp. TaxID=1965302 RepID=UPI002D7E9E03|nr:M20/M25/M40 family metallo-hydrolase [Romboutsia sp.]
MLLGAAKLLKQYEDELDGCVKLMFQPNEEGTSPKRINRSEAMVDAGLMKNPDVDTAISLHIMSGLFPNGSVITRKGPLNNPEFTEKIMNYSEELLGYPCELIEFPMSGSDDLSIISQAVPTCYLILGNGNSEEGYIYPHNNPNVLFN